MYCRIMGASFLLAIFLIAGTASAQVLSVRLNINNTQSNVYIPGVGERPAGMLGGGMALADPEHFYLASYRGGFVNGLAAKSGNYIIYGNTSGSHYLEIEQNLSGSRIFLASTQGDWHAFDDRVGLIEAGAFLTQINPAFAFSLGGLYPIRLLLKYPNIDFTGDFILGKGQHRLVIENKGISGGKPVIQISKG
jgi:hypothetical protein